MRTLFLTLVLVLFASASFAEDGYLTGRTMTKFKRGAINVVSAPLELPKKLKEHWDESSPNPIEKTVYLFGGFVKGMVFTVARMGSGFWDVATCNLDIPGNNEPLLKPDFVWADEKE